MKRRKCPEFGEQPASHRPAIEFSSIAFLTRHEVIHFVQGSMKFAGRESQSRASSTSGEQAFGLGKVVLAFSEMLQMGLFDEGKAGLTWRNENFIQPGIWSFRRKEFPINEIAIARLTRNEFPD